jgi:hypothetical protein
MKGKTKHRNCRIKYIYNVHVNLARRKLRHPGKNTSYSSDNHLIWKINCCLSWVKDMETS